MTIQDEVSFSILVHNSIFSPSLGGGTNLLSNPGFETAGGGGADVFASWTEDTDSGNATITRATTTPDPYAGTYYCEFYSVNGGTVEGSVSQDVSVSAGGRYRLTVWSRTGDIFASMQGRWSVYDNTNAGWVVSRESTGLFSNTEWQQSSIYFTAPAGCSSVKIKLYQNFDSDSYVYYDNVSMTRVQEGSLGVAANYNNMVNSYSHTSAVNIGYDKMSMAIAGDLSFLTQWVEEGLGRHIVVSEGSSGVIWEGFVNRVNLTAGGYSFSIGPMKDIINRARMVYNQLSYDTVPPVGGDTVIGHWKDELLSQARYGVLEGAISGGEGLASEMLELLNTLVPEIAWAPGGSNLSLGGSGGSFGATVECLGYGHLLDKYYYTQTGLAGEEDASTKVFNILARDPNKLFTYDIGGSITENSIQVEKYEDGTKTALGIIKDIANLGDASDNRHVFGVYRDRVFHYGAVPNHMQYRTRLSDGRLESYTGGYVNPWEVRPGNWVKVDDMALGRVSDSVRPSEDPSKIFIESVSYTAPYGLSISGGRATTFKQKIDRLGLGGM